MREKFLPFIDSLHLDCFVSRDKVYVGLPATALAPHFLLLSRQFHHDTKLSTLYRDWQKMCHRDTDAN
jgi:hypothetical protein